MDNDKYNFITKEFPELLKNLKSDTKPSWGRMNAQQMVEHLSDYLRLASGKTIVDVITPEDKLPAFKNFLYSEKQFRPETVNPLNTGAPLPERNKNLEEAIAEYHQEMKDFFSAYEKNPEMVTAHPSFGFCNFDEWMRMHYKHLSHHARQFGLMV